MCKNIVICCDGSGNEFEKNQTNVLKLFLNLLENDNTQIKFYDPGVGTSYWQSIRKLDFIFATGLTKNIEDAYSFLMEHYNNGDKVYLFGFSRGAFTVRSLAGMLYKCGLLKKEYTNLVQYASKIYNVKNNEIIAEKFKKSFSRVCPVYFIGVWDTVSSLGPLTKRKYFNIELTTETKYAYQALAIDEKRKKFQACPWTENNLKQGQINEQVWFAGSHSDIGGSYEESDLSNITLNWMTEKAVNCGLKLKATPDVYAENPEGMMHNSYKNFWKFFGSEIRKIPDYGIIYKSVIDRIESENANYFPENLPKVFFVQNGSPKNEIKKTDLKCKKNPLAVR